MITRTLRLWTRPVTGSRWTMMQRCFPPACPTLILCENGFDMFAAMELQSRLNATLLESVPAVERAGQSSYVRLKDIPQPWQDTFRAALRGSGRPLIDGEGDCARARDWTDWINGTFPRQ